MLFLAEAIGGSVAELAKLRRFWAGKADLGKLGFWAFWLVPLLWEIVHGFLAVSFLRGSFRYRVLAIVVQGFVLVAFAVTMATKIAFGGPTPTVLALAVSLSPLAALLTLLTGRPSRARLRIGGGLAVVWAVLIVATRTGLL